MKSLLDEIRRRNVSRVAIAYLAGAWLLVQLLDTVLPMFEFSHSIARLVVLILAIGFIPVLVISWAYELTPEGLRKESSVDRTDSITSQTSKRLDRFIMAILALALGYFLFDRVVLSPAREEAIAKQSMEIGAQQAREAVKLGIFEEKSVAVLPFVNRSQQAEDEFFTDGMHDELLTRLARLSDLKVISRTSVMRYKQTELSLPEIARELSVSAILEGGVQRVGNRVRIVVQLIDARTDEHLWAETYDRELSTENLFAVQSEITEQIAGALNAELSPREKHQINALPTSDLSAYNHFLRGRQFMATRHSENLSSALEQFELAVEIDPEFALAWVGIADTHFLQFEYGDRRPLHLEARKEAVAKALAIDDQLGEAYTSLATILDNEQQPDEMNAAFQKAYELSPNYAQAYHWNAESTHGLANLERKLNLLYQAVRLDPMSSVIQVSIGETLYRLGRFDEAMSQLLHLLEIDAGFSAAHIAIARLHRESGRMAEAVKWYREALVHDPGNANALVLLAYILISLEDMEGFSAARDLMSEQLGPDNLMTVGAGYWLKLDQSDWDGALALLKSLPPPVQEYPLVNRLIVDAHLFAGEFQEALDYAFIAKPGWSDPDAWPALIELNSGVGRNSGAACQVAGMFLGVGNPELGDALLMQTIDFLENEFPRLVQNADSQPDLGICYLLTDDPDRALTHFERRVDLGAFHDWWRWSKLPFWEPLRKHPRYLAMVDRIESKLEEQRQLIELENSSAKVVVLTIGTHP